MTPPSPDTVMEYQIKIRYHHKDQEALEDLISKFNDDLFTSGIPHSTDEEYWRFGT